jgi:serine/threonine protein kinase
MFETTLGTYPYMAPEIFQEKEYDCKVDVWAVAVMLHEMLFSELYFIGNSHMEVANNVKNKKYEIKNPGSISTQTQNLLISCLVKDPKKRIDAITMKSHPTFDQIRKKFETKSVMERERAPENKINEVEKILYLFKNLENWYNFICKLGNKVLSSNINERTLFAGFYLLKKGHLLFSRTLSALQSKNIPNDLKNMIAAEEWKRFKETPYASQVFQSFYANFQIVDQQLDGIIYKTRDLLKEYYENERLYLELVINKECINIDKIYDEELKLFKKECFEMGYGAKNSDLLFLSFDLKRALDLEEKISKCADFNEEEKRKEGLTFDKMLGMINT